MSIEVPHTTPRRSRGSPAYATGRGPREAGARQRREAVEVVRPERRGGLPPVPPRLPLGPTQPDEEAVAQAGAHL